MPDRIIVAHDSLRTRLSDEFDIPQERISVVPLPSPVVTKASDHPAEDPRELLFFGTQLQQVWKLRRVLSGMAHDGSAKAGLELLTDRMKTFKTNSEFLAEIGKAAG